MSSVAVAKTELKQEAKLVTEMESLIKGYEAAYDLMQKNASPESGLPQGVRETFAQEAKILGTELKKGSLEMAAIWNDSLNKVGIDQINQGAFENATFANNAQIALAGHLATPSDPVTAMREKIKSAEESFEQGKKDILSAGIADRESLLRNQIAAGKELGTLREELANLEKAKTQAQAADAQGAASMADGLSRTKDIFENIVRFPDMGRASDYAQGLLMGVQSDLQVTLAGSFDRIMKELTQSAIIATEVNGDFNLGVKLMGMAAEVKKDMDRAVSKADQPVTLDAQKIMSSKEEFIAANTQVGPLKVINTELPTPEQIAAQRTLAEEFVQGVVKHGANVTVATPGGGIEHEYHIYDVKTGELVIGAAEKIMAELNNPQIHGEVGAGFQIEVATKVAKSGANEAVELLKDLNAAESAMAKVAEKNGWIIVPTSVAASLIDGDTLPMSQDRLVQLEAELWGKTGQEATMEIPLQSGETHTFTGNCASWAAANGLHTHHGAKSLEDAVTIMNSLIVLQPVMFALSASAGQINGQPTAEKDVRLNLLLETGEAKDFYAYDKTYNLGLTTKVTPGISEALGRPYDTDVAFAILSSREQPTLADAYHGFREGHYPTVMVRPNEDNPLEVRVENRLLSMQLSSEASVGMKKFMDLAVDYYRDNPEKMQLAKRMLRAESGPGGATDSNRIEADIKAAAMKGIEAEIHDPASLGSNTKPAYEIAQALYDAVVKHGSAKGTLTDGEKALLEATVLKNIQERKTDSDRLNEKIAEVGKVDALKFFALKP